jgi:hypothetical protein
MSFWDLFVLLLIWIPLLLTWGTALADIFRREDLSGVSKSLWFMIVLLLPFVGTLIYLLTRPSSTADRGASFAEDRSLGRSGLPRDHAAQLVALSDLKDRGVLTAQEFELEKARVLA